MSNSNTEMTGWSVEARMQGTRAEKIGDQIYDNRWRPVCFERVSPPYGVPNSMFSGRVLDQCGLYSYEAVQALRWWFHANCQCTPGAFGIETRLVAHKVSARIEWDRTGEQDLVGTWPESSHPSAGDQS